MSAPLTVSVPASSMADPTLPIAPGQGKLTPTVSLWELSDGPLYSGHAAPRTLLDKLFLHDEFHWQLLKTSF